MATAATYTYLGLSPRVYPQYLNAAGTTLVATGPGTYPMTLADNWTGLPLPPGDGLWTSGTVTTTVLPPAVPGALVPGLAAPAAP
jgi:hypothetical protein